MHLSRLGLLVLALRTWWCGLSAWGWLAPAVAYDGIGCNRDVLPLFVAPKTVRTLGWHAPR